MCMLMSCFRYVGETDRKEAEELLKHWPTGTFVVRKGRSSRVITLKFPVAKDKIFFHVRVTLEDMVCVLPLSCDTYDTLTYTL